MKYILFLLIFCSLNSCVPKNANEEILSFIYDDIKNDSTRFKSYLIVKSKDVSFYRINVKNGYWVGPFYKSLTEVYSTIQFPCEHIHKVYNNVYIYDKKNIYKEYEGKFTFARADSIPVTDGQDTLCFYIDAFINYTKRAKLYQIRKGRVEVNCKPDTLVMPIVKYEQICSE